MWHLLCRAVFALCSMGVILKTCCPECGTGWRHPPAQQCLGISSVAEAKIKGQASGKVEQKTGEERDVLSVLLVQSAPPVNITLASALVAASLWFCTKYFGLLSIIN